jgi:hypothetical protein
MIGLGPEQALDFTRNNLVLGRPVDVEAILDLAGDLLRERDQAIRQGEELEQLLGDVLRAFDRFEAANAKKPGEAAMKALCALVDKLRFAAQETNHTPPTHEDDDV